MAASRLPQYIASASICIGAFATGTLIGYTGNCGDEMKAGNYKNIEMDNVQMGLVGGAMTLGAMCACIPVGILCDAIGRKLTCLLSTIPFMIGWSLIIFAQDINWMVAGRFIAGFGAGTFCVAAPMYSTEIAELAIRGTLGTFFQLFITLGILYAFITGGFLSIELHNYACAIVPLIFTVIFFFQPESPFYSLKKDKREQAEKSMKRLRGAHYDASGELKDMQDAINKEKEMKGAFSQGLKKKSTKKAIIIVFMLMFYQQLSGINVVMFYADQLVQRMLKWGAVTIGIAQVIVTVCSTVAIDKLGRIALLMISELLMSIATFLMGGYYYMAEKNAMDKETIETLKFIPITGAVVFIVGFSLGLGPIPWIASGELLIPEVKGVISGIAGTFNWFLASCVCFGYPPLKEFLNGDGIPFLVFATVSATGLFFSKIFIPETKNKPIEEIQAALGGD